MKKIISVFLILSVICSLCCVTVQADEFLDTSIKIRPYEIMKDFVEKHPDRKYSSDGALSASEYIAEFFRAGGVEPEIQDFEYDLYYSYGYQVRVERQKDRNVIATVKASVDTADTVVIGAHYDNLYDKKNGGNGAYDNGSGVGVMLALFESLSGEKGKNLPFNVEFIAFGAQESGIWGSYNYVNSIKGSKKNSIILYVNLDSLFGGDNLYIYADEVQTVQEDYFVSVAESEGIELCRPPKNKKVYGSEYQSQILGYTHAGLSSDNVNFYDAGVLTVSFSSHNWDKYGEIGFDESKTHQNVIGTDKDTVEGVEELYGESAKRKLSDAYTVIEKALLKEDFSSEMKRAMIEKPDYSNLKKGGVIPIICALFLVVVVAVVLFVNKYYVKKYPPKSKGEGEKEKERPKPFEDFD